MLSHLPPTIMIVEQDIVTRTLSSNVLERNGFNIFSAKNCEETLKILDDIPEYQIPNIFVIYSVLEGIQGVELAQILKSRVKLKNIPIIMVASQEEIIKLLQNKERDFDDYLIRPFAQNELVNKVKFWLNKTKPKLKSKTIKFRDIEIDLATYKVQKAGIEVHLGPTEFRILQCLIETPTKIFSREDIMSYVWNSKDNVETRTIDVHINRLRSALRQPHEDISVIKTVRSAGYCLELPGSR